MNIEINQRLYPFSHRPGTKVVLPGSTYVVEVYPCLIRLYDIIGTIPKNIVEIHLDLPGFFEQFTVCADLENGCIRVWGMSKNGYVRYRLLSGNKKGVEFSLERAPSSGIRLEEGNQSYHLFAKQTVVFLSNDPFIPYEIPPCDRLSLGSHKQLDWEGVNRRLLLSEFFPVWHRLGQLLPFIENKGATGGTLALLDQCQESHGVIAESHWQHLIQVGFSDLLVPHFEDTRFLGIPLPPFQSNDSSPLLLLSSGSQIIRELWIKKIESTISILPSLLPSLPVGRLLDVSLGNGIFCSIEWTKKNNSSDDRF